MPQKLHMPWGIGRGFQCGTQFRSMAGDLALTDRNYSTTRSIICTRVVLTEPERNILLTTSSDFASTKISTIKPLVTVTQSSLDSSSPFLSKDTRNSDWQPLTSIWCNRSTTSWMCARDTSQSTWCTSVTHWRGWNGWDIFRSLEGLYIVVSRNTHHLPTGRTTTGEFSHWSVMDKQSSWPLGGLVRHAHGYLFRPVDSTNL